MILLLLACAEPDDPCDAMCAAATELYGGCLDSLGVNWPAAGCADADAFAESRDTWAWEMRQLEADAGEHGATDAARVTRAATLAEGATCDAYTAADWSQPAWEVR